MRTKFGFRRTFKYLRQCPISLDRHVRIVRINFSTLGRGGLGLRRFVYEKVPQLTYGHPYVQFVREPDSKPFPQITVFFVNGTRHMIDCDYKPMADILRRLESVAGDIWNEKKTRKEPANPADFLWYGKNKKCICQVYGQKPCSACPSEEQKAKEWSKLV